MEDKFIYDDYSLYKPTKYYIETNYKNIRESQKEIQKRKDYESKFDKITWKSELPRYPNFLKSWQP